MGGTLMLLNAPVRETRSLSQQVVRQVHEPDEGLGKEQENAEGEEGAHGGNGDEPTQRRLSQKSSCTRLKTALLECFFGFGLRPSPVSSK